MHFRIRDGEHEQHEPHPSLAAEKLTECENEILWFEQTLKPTERPKLVARLFEALSGPAKEATQSQSTETFAVEDAEQDLKFL